MLLIIKTEELIKRIRCLLLMITDNDEDRYRDSKRTIFLNSIVVGHKFQSDQ